MLKPSERVPTTAMRLAELATAAGLPPGVLNVIHGGKECVDFLCDAPQVRAISFVGSDAVGKHIYERAGANGKRVQANLGAQNHGVVCEDADADAAVNAITAAAFGAAGQRCMALSRVVLVGKARRTRPRLPTLAAAHTQPTTTLPPVHPSPPPL